VLLLSDLRLENRTCFAWLTDFDFIGVWTNRLQQSLLECMAAFKRKMVFLSSLSVFLVSVKIIEATEQNKKND